ncbi:MAG: hypothetical protein MUF34_21320 [Polyangiaceae bacterium]|jgi:hypothetical protein|nr:hypothetical protein [Polyangiaceae bacterium]
MASEPRRRRVGARWVLVASLPLLLAGAGRPEPTTRGQTLFRGETPLTAMMVGHTQALPPDAVRCTNCHQPEAAPTRERTENFAPKLGPLGLTRPVARRGGPPSRYDARSFCRLLRDGIDPAHVMIPQTMPRYTLSNADCEALWAYLVTP